jgi:hypothetical protein
MLVRRLKFGRVSPIEYYLLVCGLAPDCRQSNGVRTLTNKGSESGNHLGASLQSRSNMI